MDNKKFYEQFDWEKLQSKHLQAKTEIIIKNIPDDVKTILDVGCGNGAITNILGEKYTVTGLDRSKEALKHVKKNKIQSSSDNIPFAEGDFDMLLSSELLEHLPDKIFDKTIAEFRRIAPNYIFISVPNREKLSKSYIKCEKCGYIYNRSYHLRSFNREKIINLFPEYKEISSFEFGAKIRQYNRYISKFKHKITPAKSWIPYYWTPPEKRKTMCPRCEHRFNYPFEFNLLSFLFDCANVLISPKLPYWLFVLLKKR